MEETEILLDMSVNFKDFAVETRFVVAICLGACATFSTNKYCRSPLDTYILHSSLLSRIELVSRSTSHKQTNLLQSFHTGEIFNDCQLAQAGIGKIDYIFPKILTLPADNGVKASHKNRLYSHSIFVLAFLP